MNKLDHEHFFSMIAVMSNLVCFKVDNNGPYLWLTWVTI